MTTAKLQKILNQIMGYCDKHDTCSTCKLFVVDECFISSMRPCEWDQYTNFINIMRGNENGHNNE